MHTTHPLPEIGQSFWLDNLSRAMLEDGTLEARIEDQGVTGITSNPSTFAKALAEGEAYDDDVRVLGNADAEDERLMEALMIEDVRRACDLMHSVYEASEGTDGFVSIEVNPWLARDTTETIGTARRLWREVDRPNAMVKIPGTRQGLPAIERCLIEGINVNITLLFSVARYEQVIEHFKIALAHREAEGQSSDRLFSVASFFLSRIDTLVDELLSHRGWRQDERGSRRPALLGRTAISCAKHAYQVYQREFGKAAHSPENSGQPQKLLWASTGAKNPAYGALHYIRELVHADTISTLPEATLESVAQTRELASETLETGWEEAQRTIEAIEQADIDLEMVGQRLEDEGLQKFIDSWEEARKTLRSKRKSMSA